MVGKFVSLVAQRWIVLVIHFQTSQPESAKCTIHFCGICYLYIHDRTYPGLYCMKQEGLDLTGLNGSSAQIIPISSKGPSAGIFPGEGTRNHNHYNNCHQHHSIFYFVHADHGWFNKGKPFGKAYVSTWHGKGKLTARLCLFHFFIAKVTKEVLLLGHWHKTVQCDDW